MAVSAEQLEEWSEKYSENSNYSDFKEMPDSEKLHPSEILSGYLKLASLMKNPAKFEFGAEHEKVNLYVNEDDLIDEVSEADIVYLGKCGIHFSQNECGFWHFT